MTPPATAPATGLRARKRAETRSRIEAAALDLVLEDGLEAATVDAISARADISPRTFFNYFESKDAAVLGLQAREVDAASVVGEESDPVVATVRLMVAALGVGEGGRTDQHARRIEAIRRHPQIVSGQFPQIAARKQRIAVEVARLLGEAPGSGADADATARAGVLMGMCGHAVRAAVAGWACGDGEDAAASADIEDRAVSLVREVLERIA